ncbi:conserved virulence factor C family protein [Salirhabdus salicampi]|uniref:conserved virulence factor C family protein n=1 Tax=Salirhabdus salicampi TaxID=476102 RepID=UPI0020C4C7F7|nr:conserved virulence factor C family protein [Salirhabdus salicampi]MCP8615431.1 conserved virulence factor C family protein [Salirhabdus salicampi]
MQIVTIEPTPSPNSMKIVLSTPLPEGERHNYKHGETYANAPKYIQKIIAIDGVKNLYHVADFIALDRNPKYSWEDILPQVKHIFGTTMQEPIPTTKQKDPEETYGEVKVLIQMFRGIPMQLKLIDDIAEHRIGLPEMFMNAAMEASQSSPNFVMERKWVEQSPRYGSIDEIGKEIVEELNATYDEQRLAHLTEKALHMDNNDVILTEEHKDDVTLEDLDHPDWKVRFAALDRIEPTYQSLPLLEKALHDSKTSIRRLATAYLGMIEEPEVLPYLYKALQDKVATVRRTAGDCLSDLGFPEAIPEMVKALNDPSKLVRWRAAMFLYEVGDHSAVPALQDAIRDPEFEVRMQAKMALRRIEQGEEAKGSVWHQMTEATKKERDNS